MTALSDFVSGVAGVDLASVPTINDVTITNTGGTNAVILSATDLRAGVMTTTQVEKLNNIEEDANNYIHPTYPGDDFNIDTGVLTGAQVISRIDINLTTDTQGHVTDANASETVRTLTLANLGYTGDPDANKYIHPGYPGDDFDVDTTLLSGAWVPSRININMSSDGEGHVTDANGFISSRQLTADDLNAYDKDEIDTILQDYSQIKSGAGVYTPGLTGGTTNGTVSGTIVWVSIGNLVLVTGRVTWTTPPTGTGQIRITGLPYTSDYNTGFGFSGNNVENQANAANGMHITLAAGSDQLYIWGYNENGVSSPTDGNDFNSNGYINVNFSYYSSQVPV